MRKIMPRGDAPLQDIIHALLGSLPFPLFRSFLPNLMPTSRKFTNFEKIVVLFKMAPFPRLKGAKIGGLLLALIYGTLIKLIEFKWPDNFEMTLGRINDLIDYFCLKGL